VILLAVALVVGLLVAFAGGIAILSESGEVVVVQTFDESQRAHDTRLWIVDDGDEQWLRAGNPTNRWYQNILRDPSVRVTRGPETRAYRAVPADEPVMRDRINQLMEEKYGFADRAIGKLGRGDSPVPIQLEPQQP
jgi:hypothetical protein